MVVLVCIEFEDYFVLVDFGLVFVDLVLVEGVVEGLVDIFGVEVEMCCGYLVDV